MTNDQNICREIESNDYEVLTGLRPRMSDEYRRKTFFPAMFRAVKIYTDQGKTNQFAFEELSRLTGYTMKYLKFTYYQLLKQELKDTETIDDKINPLVGEQEIN